MDKPDICPFCAAAIVRKISDGPYFIHEAPNCVLAYFMFDDTPENIVLWNRRVGKPLWAKGAKP